MKTNMKKFLSLLLAFSMVLSLMSVSVFASGETENQIVPVVSSESQGTYTITHGEDTYEHLHQVVDGFYQNAKKYADSSNFYITSKEGLEYFQKLINEDKTTVDGYASSFTSNNAEGFYQTNVFTGKTVHLLTDVDLQYTTWTPIGYTHNNDSSSDSYGFEKGILYGSFNGHGHKISNFSISSSKDYKRVGFFGYIGAPADGSQTISNLTLENVTVQSGTYVGALVGNAQSNLVSFENCHVTGVINISGTYAGAIYGIGNGNVKNCSVSGDAGSKISGYYFAGGLVGAQRNNNVDQSITGNSVSGVAVSSNQYAGGVVGAMAEESNKPPKGTLTIGGNDVADDVKYTGVYSNKLIVEFDDTDLPTCWYTTVIKYPAAQIGNEYYDTLAEALTAAASMSGTAENPTVIQLRAGTIEEGAVTFPARLKNVKIQGAADKATTLKNTVLNSATGSFVDYENISFDGIVFDNSRILFTGSRSSVTYKDWSITNCEFKNIVTDPGTTAYSAVHIGTLAAAETMNGFTFSNNVIDGVSGGTNSGLLCNRVSGTVTIKDNVIGNVAHNAIQLLNSTADAKITISGNILGSNADEGVVNLAGGTPANISVTYNVFNMGGNQPAIAYLPGVDVSGNYWGGSSPSETALGNSVYSSYYNETSSKEKAGFTLSNLQFGADVVAAIGAKGYATLAAAVAAAQDGDTVTLLKDVTLSNAATALGETNQYLLAIDKNLTLDGGNNTITLNSNTGRGIGIKGANGKIDVLIKNVKIDGKTGNKHYVDTRGNLNSLTLEKVTIDTRQASGNTQPLTIGGNQSDKASVNIKGTTLTAISAGYPITTFNPVTLNIAEKSVLNGYCSLYIRGTSNSAGSAGSEITIDDSTLNVPNPFTYESASNFSAIVFETESNNTGSTVEITNSTIEISTSNTAYNWLLDDRAGGNTLNLGDGNKVTINGETAMLAYRVGTFNITGGTFSFNNGGEYAFRDVINITGGTFNKDPRAFVAEGYAAVKMTEDTWKVGKAETTKSQSITTGQDTYTVTTTVKEDNTTLAESSASVAVKSGVAVGTTVDSVELTNVNTEAIAQTAAELNVGAKTIDIDVVLNKENDTSAAAVLLGAAVGEVFEVYPEASYVAKDEDGNTIETGKMDVSKTTVGSFTFNLYLDDTKFHAGDLVTVIHYGIQTETWTKKVQSDNNGLFVELTLSDFSHVAVKAVDTTDLEAPTMADYTVEIADAVSGIQTVHPGDTFTMDVKVKGDDYCGADLTVTYDSANFELTNIAYGKDSANNTILNDIAFSDQTEGTAHLKLYTSGGAKIADGTAPDVVAATLTFKVKDNAANGNYPFDFNDAIPQYQVSYNVLKAAETPASKTGDTVKVVATKYTVSFYNSQADADANGPHVDPKATREVYSGSGLAVDQVPTSSVLTYDSTIYDFAGWALTGTTDVLTKEVIAQTQVTADVSYVAIYTPKTFTVTLPEGMTKVSGISAENEAAYGTAVVAQIDSFDSDNFSYAVTYTVAGGAPTTLTIDDGKVTVPGDAVRGNIVFTLTKTVNKDSFVIAEAENYVTGYTLYLVKKAVNGNASIYSPDNTAGTLVYTFDGKPMFYVKEYEAYAILVQGYKESPKDCVGIETKSNDSFRGDLAIDDPDDGVVKGDVNKSGAVEYSDFLATYYGYIVALEKADGDNMAVYLRANLERGIGENAEAADWTANSVGAASYKLNIADLAAVDAVYSGTGA